MKKIIEFLVYTFTDRLDKVITITLNQGIPCKEDVELIKANIEKQYKKEVVLVFTDNNTPMAIHETYIKKKK